MLRWFFESIRAGGVAGMALIVLVVVALVALGVVGFIPGAVVGAAVTGWVGVVIGIQRNRTT